MPSPNNKESLIMISKDILIYLFNFLFNFAFAIPSNISFDIDGRDKNIHDILVYLHKWHITMLQWSKNGISGIKTHIPAKGSTFKDLPALNYQIWQKYQTIGLGKILDFTKTSHTNVIKIIEKHINEDFFWKGIISLGSYLTLANSSYLLHLED